MRDRFRTKTGHATVTPDALTIERTGLRGGLAESLQGTDGTSRTWMLYGVLVVAFLFLAWSDWQEGNLVVGALELAIAGWMGASLAASRDFSMAPVVHRAETHRVQAVRGWRLLTRDRLVVHFTDDGKPRRRFVLLPGVLQGDRELDRAVSLLRTHGWPVS